MSKSFIIVIHNLFPDDGKELNFLSEDCQHFQEKICFNAEERGAALDPFEFRSISPTSAVRSNKDRYLEERWDIPISLNHRNFFDDLLFEIFPNIIRKLLNITDTLFLFNEHYIVKEKDSNLSFKWHRDDQEQFLAFPDYFKYKYISIWCSIDSTNEENGSIAFDDVEEIHLIKEECINRNLEDFFPNDTMGPSNSAKKGNILTLSPGSIVLFASSQWHRSGVNQSNHSRRAYYAQYSLLPIIIDSEILSFAIPC